MTKPELPSSFKEDLRNNRTLLLVIDNEKQFISEDNLQGPMERYGEMMPQFCDLASHYMTVVNIALDGYSYSKQHEEELYDPKTLRLKPPSDGVVPPHIFCMDFLQAFDPHHDRYFAKNTRSTMVGGFIENFIKSENISSVIAIGVRMEKDMCIPSSIRDLRELQKSYKKLKHIAIISDLTNAGYKDDSIERRHEIIQEIVGNDIITLSAQNTLDVLNQELDIDEPPAENMKVIYNQKPELRHGYRKPRTKSVYNYLHGI